MKENPILEHSIEEHKSKGRLNTVVAATVALIAALMAISNVKDGNIVQAIQQSQADRVDNWAWYQVHKARIESADSTRILLELQPKSEGRDRAIAKLKGEMSNQTNEAEEIKFEMNRDAKAFNKLNLRDDQFDAAEALLSLSITLLAMTSLTQKKWLYAVALVPAVVGSVMAAAGIFNFAIYIPWLAKLLGV